MDKDRRFIEESFPVKEVSIESAREKNIRHGHISTLHIWWARRPLASSRATNYAALIQAPENVAEWDRKRQFIAEFSKWENSLNQAMIQRAREDILAANDGKPPKVLDPMIMPRFVGIIRVTPGQTARGEVAESAEIEQIGMETAMSYEVRNGRTPQDASD